MPGIGNYFEKITEQNDEVIKLLKTIKERLDVD